MDYDGENGHDRGGTWIMMVRLGGIWIILVRIEVEMDYDGEKGVKHGS